MVTTIQLNEQVKKQLDFLKTNKETYEEIILGLIKFADKIRRKRKELLIEGYEEIASENLRISKEFELIEDLNKWDW